MFFGVLLDTSHFIVSSLHRFSQAEVETDIVSDIGIHFHFDIGNDICININVVINITVEYKAITQTTSMSMMLPK